MRSTQKLLEEVKQRLDSQVSSEVIPLIHCQMFLGLVKEAVLTDTDRVVNVNQIQVDDSLKYKATREQVTKGVLSDETINKLLDKL